MRTAKSLFAFGAALLIAGCVPSLHPLYSEKDLVFEPALVGVWAEEKSEDTLTFQKSGGKAYELTYSEKGTPARFEAHLLRLGEFLFLDFYPEEPDIKGDFYQGHLIRAHSFYKFHREGDNLRLEGLDGEWLKKMMEEKKVKIGHERLDGNLVLTASTGDLQKFVRTYAEDQKAFPTGEVLHRQK